MPKQKLNIKSSIVDANNYLNGVFLSFYFLNRELYLEQRLINIFSSCFSFHKANYHSNERKTCHCNILKNIILKTSSKPNIVVIISVTSIMNNIATSIAYIHSFNSPLNKTLHYAISITSIEVELFVLRYGINQAVLSRNDSYQCHNIFCWQLGIIRMIVSNWVWIFI